MSAARDQPCRSMTAHVREEEAIPSGRSPGARGTHGATDSARTTLPVSFPVSRPNPL